MSARTRWHVLAIAIPLLLLPGSRAFAGAWSLAPGEYYSEIRAGWFSSDGYHDPDGKRKFLYGGGLWEERSLRSYTELGWKPKLSVVLGIPVVSVTRRPASPALEIPTQTGLGDGLLGFRYRLANGRRAASIELDWEAPLGYERDRFLSHADSVAAGDSNGDGDSLDANAVRQLGQPVLGDGVQNVTVKLALGTALGRGFLDVAGGYRYRFEDPQDQIVLAADLGWWLTRSLLLAGRYEGEIASEGDRPSDEPDQHRVGPTLVYRLDDHMDLFVGSLHTASASNALHTDEVRVGFAFRQSKLNRLQGFLGGTAAP